MRKILTSEIFENMLKDYHNGMCLVDLSNKYGFQEQTIQKHFKSIGITIFKRNVKNFTEQEVNHIIEDYKNGMKPYELSIKYQRNSATIIGKLKSLGVYVNSTYRFSFEDIEFLKVHYPKGDWTAIEKRFPDLTKTSIHTKMSKLGISLDNYFWDKKDEELLIKCYSELYGNITDLIKLFEYKYTYAAIISKARKLGLKTRNFWSSNEIEILKENYSTHTVDDMKILLPNRSRDSIIGQAKKLGLTNKSKLDVCFSAKEKMYIANNFNNMSDKEIGKKLHRSSSAINCYRFRNRLMKTYEKSSYLDLSEYIRRNNIEWKKNSMKKCSYRCVLFGKRFDDIHHIYGFNLILNEALEVLNLDVKDNINKYSKLELKKILLTFREIQSHHPLGVCLTKEIHMKFHEIYGYGNNMEEQWNHFVENYNKKVA